MKIYSQLVIISAILPIFSSYLYKNIATAESYSYYCSPLGKGEELCICVEAAGNEEQEVTDNLWPLVVKSCWKYGGVNRRWQQKLQPYKLQIKIENTLVYEGQASTPVDFVKNAAVGYWGPDQNLNLRWLVVSFSQSSYPYFWAKGDIRYDRDTLQCVRRFRYDSLDPNKPPYIIMPRILKPNPENNGLTNSFVYFQKYYSCYIPAGGSCYDCSLQPLPHKNSWFIGVTNAKIKTPFFQGNWVDAKRIEFVELSVPEEETSPSAPYTDDINLACKTDSNGQLVYRGVREDWYFVDNVGPALIITRDVGLEPDNECIYYVARENLTFQNADTYSYLVAKDNNGYDPTWSYSLLPFLADFNNNGKIDPQDVKALLLQYFAAGEQEKDLYPTAGDNLINSLDFGKLKLLFTLQ